MVGLGGVAITSVSNTPEAELLAQPRLSTLLLVGNMHAPRFYSAYYNPQPAHIAS